MKHITLPLLFIAAFALSAIFCNAQEKEKPSEEKTFQIGIGVGASTMTNQGAFGKVFGAGLSLQAENHFSPQFSGFVSAGYNLLFSTEGGGTLGLIPIQAGPRIYFSKTAFIGVGVGYGILTGEGESEGAFNYFPHLGINTKSGQFIFGYDALTKDGNTIGFVELKFIFKL